jgi:sulfatase maturation enzyme AslB (radical SAM superfamily)
VEHNVNVLLSIDGCKEIQDFQRPRKDGQSSFDKLKDIIPYLLLKMPNVTFRATLTKFSLDYLDKTMQFAENYGFKYITFVPNLFEIWEPEDYYKWEQFIDKEAIKLMQKISWKEPVNCILSNLTEGFSSI